MKRLAIAFLIFLAAILPASASTLTVNVNTPNTMKILWVVDTYQVSKGQAVVIKFKVTNVGTVPATFDRVRVIIKDPDGNVRFDKFFMLGKQVLQPGESKEYEVKTTLAVDKVGIWTATVQVYNGAQKLCEDTKQFQVVSPEVSTQITAINGVAVAGLISTSLAGLYVANKKGILRV